MEKLIDNVSSKYSPAEHLNPTLKNTKTLNDLFDKCKKIRRRMKKNKRKLGDLLSMFKNEEVRESAVLWTKNIIINYCTDFYNSNNDENYKKMAKNMKENEKDIYWIGYLQIFADALKCTIKYINTEGIIEEYIPIQGERFFIPLIFSYDKSFKLFVNKLHIIDELNTGDIKDYVDPEILPLFEKDVEEITLLKKVDEVVKADEEEHKKVCDDIKSEQKRVLDDILKDIENLLHKQKELEAIKGNKHLGSFDDRSSVNLENIVKAIDIINTY